MSSLRSSTARVRGVVLSAGGCGQRKERAMVRATDSGGESLPTTLPGVLRARPVETLHGRFGYRGIRTFSTNPDPFVAEFVRLAEALPQKGLSSSMSSRERGGIIFFRGRTAPSRCSRPDG